MAHIVGCSKGIHFLHYSLHKFYVSISRSFKFSLVEVRIWLEFFSHYKYIKYHKLGFKWKKIMSINIFFLKNVYNLSYCVNLIIYLKMENFIVFKVRKSNNITFSFLPQLKF